MKKMCAAVAVTAAFLSLAQGVRAQSWLEKKAPAQAGKTAKSGWFEDLDEAKAEAKKSGRPIFALFTGSDWCGFCILLEKEVLSGKAFQSFARDNLVLFKADYPNKRKVPPKIKSQNDALRGRLGGAGGVPRVYLITADEKLLGTKGGYHPGQGAKEYIRQIGEILEKNGIAPVTSSRGGRRPGLSPYERMKAEKAARDAAAAAKKTK